MILRILKIQIYGKKEMIEQMLYLVFIDVVNGSSPIILEVITRRKTNDVIRNEY